MIKVTAQNGTQYLFPTATSWEIYGAALRIYTGQQHTAEFSSFLLVQRESDPEQPQEETSA